MLGSILKHFRDATIFNINCFVIIYEIVFNYLLYST